MPWWATPAWCLEISVEVFYSFALTSLSGAWVLPRQSKVNKFLFRLGIDIKQRTQTIQHQLGLQLSILPPSAEFKSSSIPLEEECPSMRFQ
ncbi:hypothetical protein F4604DRAFT_5737 [Suillus subluteus]|nr:hypothetical protein F4604DRAFT_5737 [Suillus subluteus]